MRSRGALAAAAAVVLSLAFASTASAARFVVLYKSNDVPASAKSDVQAAGGTWVYGYDAIGVAIARSSSASFASRMEKDNRVEGVASTAGFATRINDPSGGSADASGPPPGDLPNAPASDSDTFSPLQWDMRQIHTPQAHAITGGSPAVVAGDIDTGLDWSHPDLAQNVDFANSVSCIGGVPDQDPAAWDDHNGHGTHTAGTIAAAANGLGIVGVAPNVKIAGIKAGTDEGGFFFPEAVVCSFMWAGSHHLDVTNNSYFADPFLFNCRNDPKQRAIWKAEQRAIRYAMKQGVTVVAAEGNESDDLSHPSVDVISPDFPPGSEVERRVTNACVVIPVEISGVVGVTADGNDQQGTSAGQYPDYLKSYYSSYGVSTADVVAPGGDRRFGITPEAPNGRVLSTFPPDVTPDNECPVDLTEKEPVEFGGEPTAFYCYLQGTSMASPHVAGVAALIISRYGDASTPQNGKLRPGQVSALISQTADPQECPTSLPLSPFPGQPSYVEISELIRASGEPPRCQGGPGHNSWYGNGQADALNAVTHASGNH
jgi:lantibiotic leader peptide-processing serine protease